MLKINRASKTFLKGTLNENKALDDFSLSMAQGDFVTVVGSNGAGKSTLFNAIGGSFYVDGGSIVIGGNDVTYDAEHKRSSYIGRVFQDPMKGTAPNMTIEENLALSYTRSRRKPFSFALRKKDSVIFREALAAYDMGLENRMRDKAGLLSGGQRQALTLLMCTIVPPKLLLLDEHTAALDPATAEKVIEITNQTIRKNNLTTMMITHNITNALNTGNRTIMMDAGKIILDISAEERRNMTVSRLMELYSNKSRKVLDSDRMLLSQ